jgi:hypothetical protein
LSEYTPVFDGVIDSLYKIVQTFEKYPEYKKEVEGLARIVELENNRVRELEKCLADSLAMIASLLEREEQCNCGERPRH